MTNGRNRWRSVDWHWALLALACLLMVYPVMELTARIAGLSPWAQSGTFLLLYLMTATTYLLLVFGLRHLVDRFRDRRLLSNPRAIETLQFRGPFQEIQTAVVRLISEGPRTFGSGNGVLIHPDGYVLTAAHCVPPESEVKVILWNLEVRETRVVVRVEDLDCALLQITDARPPYPSVPVGSSLDLRLSGTYYLCGWEPHWKLATGAAHGSPRWSGVSGYPRILPQVFCGVLPFDKVALVEFYGHISPGYSGSPVWDPKTRRIVGLATASLYSKEADTRSDRSSVLTPEIIHSVLRQAGVTARRTRVPLPSIRPEEQARAFALLSLFESHLLEASVEDWTSLIELWPGLFAGRLARARVHLKEGRPDLAVADAAEAVRMRPEMDVVRDFYGQALAARALEALDREDHEAACRDAREALQYLDDASQHAENALSTLLNALWARAREPLQAGRTLQALEICRQGPALFEGRGYRPHRALRPLLKTLVDLDIRPRLEPLVQEGKVEEARDVLLSETRRLSAQAAPYLAAMAAEISSRRGEVENAVRQYGEAIAFQLMFMGSWDFRDFQMDDDYGEIESWGMEAVRLLLGPDGSGADAPPSALADGHDGAGQPPPG